jgi:hypothetical protein
MLGDVIAVKAAAVISLGDLEARLVEIAQGELVAVEMIEDAEFHAALPAALYKGAERRV